MLVPRILAAPYSLSLPQQHLLRCRWRHVVHRLPSRKHERNRRDIVHVRRGLLHLRKRRHLDLHW